MADQHLPSAAPPPEPLRFGPVQVFLGEKSGKYPDGNQVIVTGTDTRVCFDMPLVSHRLNAELDGTDLVVMGHMHEDHSAGLKLLPRAEVFAPDADVDAVRSWDGLARHYGYGRETLGAMRTMIERKFHWVPRPDAEGYADGHTWDLGGCRVRALHMPGHTGGHSVLLVEPEGVAFIGDFDLSSFGPYYGDACSSLPLFLESLERIKAIPARVWVTSHHKGVITERETFLHLLQAFAAKIVQRERAILVALAQAPRTLAQLAAQRFLYPPGYQDVFVEDAERFTLLAHLSLVAQQGKVVEEGGTYRLI